jgi:hypothetical protein
MKLQEMKESTRSAANVKDDEEENKCDTQHNGKNNIKNLVEEF